MNQAVLSKQNQVHSVHLSVTLAPGTCLEHWRSSINVISEVLNRLVLAVIH